MARPASTSTPAGKAREGAGESKASARERIEAEHQRLNALLRSLVQSRDLARLRELLDELDQLLVEHFAGEEGTEGLHQVVGEGAGHRLPDLQRLYDEHREILARLGELRTDCARLLAGEVRQIHDGVSRLAEKLRRHEQREDELFGEAFYTDLGGRS